MEIRVVWLVALSVEDTAAPAAIVDTYMFFPPIGGGGGGTRNVNHLLLRVALSSGASAPLSPKDQYEIDPLRCDVGSLIGNRGSLL